MEKSKKAQPEEEKEVDEKQQALDNNLRFYSQVREVPENAKKAIAAGRLKGKTDINPMWRIKKITEIFGPCGFGWKYEIVKQWTEVYGQEVKCFVNLNLYVRDPETKEWSEAIPGNGGSAMVSAEKSGVYVDDDAYKKALTDALSIAMKALGVGADVWYAKDVNVVEDSKYEQTQHDSPRQQSQPRQQSSPSANVFSGEQLAQALEDVNNATSRDELTAIWNKWGNICPAICGNGTQFYNSVATKMSELKQ